MISNAISRQAAYMSIPTYRHANASSTFVPLFGKDSHHCDGDSCQISGHDHEGHDHAKAHNHKPPKHSRKEQKNIHTDQSHDCHDPTCSHDHSQDSHKHYHHDHDKQAKGFIAKFFQWLKEFWNDIVSLFRGDKKTPDNHDHDHQH